MMTIPGFDDIIEQNDQTAARREHLDALERLVGNVYPNKFIRSSISGAEDTITNILRFPPVAAVLTEINAVVGNLAERQRPPAEVKDALNARLKELGSVRIAGRLAVPPRVMGKAAFVHLSDGMSRLQIYVRKDDAIGVYNGSEPAASDMRPSGWDIFQLLDHGDFVGVEGYLFITNTGELSVHVETLQFLAKAMLPMPDKMHGIADAEIKQRQRYIDLIGSSLRVKTDEEIEEEKQTGIKHLTTREVFQTRAKIISSMRHFLEDSGYIEVETPMLTPKATGAAAKPFKTHHNALDIDLYARIAPELYLKRLVVGGFEKVYELNRNFRNEGISYKHNPEFTMLEFYCAYMDVNGMMDFCEKMLRESVQKATGGLTVQYEDKIIDFGKFERISMRDAVRRYLPDLPQDFTGGSFPRTTLLQSDLNDIVLISALAEFARQSEPTKNLVGMINDAEELISVPKEKIHEYEEAGYSVYQTEIELGFAWDLKIDKFRYLESLVGDERSVSLGNALATVFDNYVERQLVNPTFIIDYPKSISPLSKASPQNPQVAERFELFINGMEVANGFSELNDPKEQYNRFKEQTDQRAGGDEEAMELDEDYIRALSYGMPPAAGIGIGIDRLVMLLTNKHSIRDVILFPHMRPEKGGSATERTESTEES